MAINHANIFIKYKSTTETEYYLLIVNYFEGEGEAISG